MTDQKKAFRTAAACFPRYAAEIERAYEEIGEFRSICTDLLECDEALNHWSKVDTDEGASRSEEYAELFESLKQEVLDWLATHGFLSEGEVEGSAESEQV